jgi:hydroxypyruvate isomerase
MRQTFTLSANISMLFADLPFVERIEAAANAGFRAVECQFPYAFSASDVAGELARHGLVMNGINTPQGDPAKGEFGMAAAPGMGSRFRDEFEQALAYAATVGARMIHVMSGMTGGQSAAARDAFFENFTWAADRARAGGVTLLIEPLNAVDRPGYFVSRSDEVVALLGELACENVKLLFDVYHIQIMEGDLLRRLGRHWPHVGHVQLASVPRRHEPDEGEVAFAAILGELSARGYGGFVGAEYNPRGKTQDGLGWAAPWLGR